MTAIDERIVELRIGPPGGQGRSWRNPLFIEFEVEKTSGKHPNKAKVVIYGLSDNSRQFIEQKNQILQLLVGEKIPGQIFIGDISRRGIETKIQGADRKTTIKASDGQRIFRDTYFSKSYPPNIKRSIILPDVIAATTLSTGYISSQLPEKIYANGFSVAGWSKDVLTELLGGDGIWSIQNNKLQILAGLEQLPGNAIVIKSTTGMVGSPQRTDKGVNVTTKLSREIQPGGPVRIESTFFTGEIRVTKVTHTGNSRGMNWQSKIVGVPIK